MSASDSGRFNTREWVLEPESEYRFELDPGSSLAIRVRPHPRPITRMMIDTKPLQVLKGHAEVFGAELADGKYYLFGHECKAAIFTWQGCTIEMSSPSFEFFLSRITDQSYQSFEYVTGTPSTDYVSDETPMHAYANVHLALEKMRVRALSSHRGSPLPPGPEQEVDPEPPRVLVLGPENSGKTTVCKILTNYAVRAGQGWMPMYVNTDPSEVCVCLCLCLVPLGALWVGCLRWW
jgi:polyribonucleotide 5'-hydroxyl-kinase